MNYKVKKEDLIGEIKDFPIEVVQKMIERQVEQGNEADVTVFQSNCWGGFVWEDTDERTDFWVSVIGGGNFDIFFKRYPKK